MSKSVLIIGGSTGIGAALAAHYKAEGTTVSVISRQNASSDTAGYFWFQDQLQSDQHSIECVEQALVQQPDTIFICNGVLYDDAAMPEKAIRQLDFAILQQRLQSNLLVPARYLQLLFNYLCKTDDVKVLVLSAKVGSISDNALGGWYSYRISKAALNMLIKNISIELGRINKSAVVLSVHPGTTDTVLSEPFQRNLAPGQLQSAAITAQRLAALARAVQPEQTGALCHWDGSILPF